MPEGEKPIPHTPKIKLPSANTDSQKKETPSLLRSKPAVKSEAVEKKPLLEEKTSPFTDEQVQKYWASFKEERLAQGASDTERLVLDRRLEKTDYDVITIYLESQLEISILEKCEPDLLQYLKKHLDNTVFSIQKEVTEIKSTKNLYTSREKFDYMVKQNPALQELKDKLGLDFDY
ncbi:MAG: hypothetical protein JXR10_05670 [Cyclobacteriaceae bacterium]